MSFTIRPVTTADVDAVIQVVSATLAEFGLTFGVGSSTDDEVRALPASYADRGGAFFVAVDESGAIVGTAGVAPIVSASASGSGSGSGVFELRKMYLVPAARGHRLGARLFDACMAFCRAHKARQLVLDTRDNMKDAIAFYERRGFVQDDSQIRGARCTRGYRLDLQD